VTDSAPKFFREQAVVASQSICIFRPRRIRRAGYHVKSDRANNCSKGTVHLPHIRRSRADAAKYPDSGHLFNTLINSVISDKS
jgi:hypothetical protein